MILHQPAPLDARNFFWNSLARVSDAMCPIPTTGRQRTLNSFSIYSKVLRDACYANSPPLIAPFSCDDVYANATI